MIAKGTPHRDGAILARYLVTGKERERAELWELRGFPCASIVPAFRSVHVMAAATKCQAPFFHVSIRNPNSDYLDRSQWEVAANTIERMLGLTDQPRALAFHVAEDTGHAHLHIAWSRINLETLTAKPLPFFKLRLKQVCRELEERLGLTPVPNERRSSIDFAPTRSEDEQARRLGVDIHVTREGIKNCFERSDCGRSFRDALAQEGMVLAQGDRRDFLVMDRAGGIHALGKRILGMSAAQIRGRFADLSRDALPTLEQARESIAANKQLSADDKVEDVCRHTKSSPTPGSTRKRTGHGVTERQVRAEGKEQPRDQVRTRRVTAYSAVPLDHLATEIPAPSISLENENALIDQLGLQPLAPPGNATHNTQLLPAIDGEKHTSGPGSRRETAGPESAPAALPKIEIPLSAHKMPSLASRLRDQFRQLVKQLTARDPTPRLTSRKRRRDEIGGSFGKVAMGLLRSVARMPPLHFLDPDWEAFTWLRIWEYNDPSHTNSHQDHCTSTLTNHSPHL